MLYPSIPVNSEMGKGSSNRGQRRSASGKRSRAYHLGASSRLIERSKKLENTSKLMLRVSVPHDCPTKSEMLKLTTTCVLRRTRPDPGNCRGRARAAGPCRGGWRREGGRGREHDGARESQEKSACAAAAQAHLEDDSRREDEGDAIDLRCLILCIGMLEPG